MKKHYAIAATLACIMLAGCSNNTESTPIDTATGEVLPIATNEVIGEPSYSSVWLGNSISHDNLTFGDSTGGNFRVTHSLGDYGYEEYDVQYDNNTGYKSTYIYIFPTYGQSIEEYIETAGLMLNIEEVENVQDNLYVANVTENGLPGFDSKLTQDKAYESVMSALGIDISSTVGESDYNSSAPATEYITMKESYIVLKVGDVVLLEPNHIPETYSNLVFDVDDPLIAELTTDGTITGISPGTTYIHISTPDYVYATTVIVEVE